MGVNLGEHLLRETGCPGRPGVRRVSGCLIRIAGLFPPHKLSLLFQGAHVLLAARLRESIHRRVSITSVSMSNDHGGGGPGGMKTASLWAEGKSPDGDSDGASGDQRVRKHRDSEVGGPQVGEAGSEWHRAQACRGKLDSG